MRGDATSSVFITSALICNDEKWFNFRRRQRSSTELTHDYVPVLQSTFLSPTIFETDDLYQNVLGNLHLKYQTIGN